MVVQLVTVGTIVSATCHKYIQHVIWLCNLSLQTHNVNIVTQEQNKQVLFHQLQLNTLIFVSAPVQQTLPSKKPAARTKPNKQKTKAPKRRRLLSDDDFESSGDDEEQSAPQTLPSKKPAASAKPKKQKPKAPKRQRVLNDDDFEASEDDEEQSAPVLKKNRHIEAPPATPIQPQLEVNPPSSDRPSLTSRVPVIPFHITKEQRMAYRKSLHTLNDNRGSRPWTQEERACLPFFDDVCQTPSRKDIQITTLVRGSKIPDVGVGRLYDKIKDCVHKHEVERTEQLNIKLLT